MGKPVSYYLINFFWSSLAMYVMLYIHAQGRDPNSTRTPQKFSNIFLIWDNIRKITVTYALLFAAYALIPEMNQVFALGLGVAASFGVVFLFNFLADKLPGFKRFIQHVKEKDETPQN